MSIWKRDLFTGKEVKSGEFTKGDGFLLTIFLAFMFIASYEDIREFAIEYYEDHQKEQLLQEMWGIQREAKAYAECEVSPSCSLSVDDFRTMVKYQLRIDEIKDTIILRGKTK